MRTSSLVPGTGPPLQLAAVFQFLPAGFSHETVPAPASVAHRIMSAVETSPGGTRCLPIISRSDGALRKQFERNECIAISETPHQRHRSTLPREAITSRCWVDLTLDRRLRCFMSERFRGINSDRVVSNLPAARERFNRRFCKLGILLIAGRPLSLASMNPGFAGG